MSSSSSSSPPKLQTLNYVNVLAYVLYFVVAFGTSLAGLPDNATLSKKYQTLITPSGYAFAIWGIIFTAELVWTIFQVLPSYRSNQLVTKGVGYHFALASLAQSLWTIAFALEQIALSMVCMVGILVPLLAILKQIVELPTSRLGYWLLKFPFEIHGAWIMAATCLNVNLLLVAHGASATAQTAVGWLSLAVLLAAGAYATLRKVWVVPGVVVWASFAIANELSGPLDTIVATFPEATIRHTRIASMVVAYALVLLVTFEVVRSWFFRGSTSTGDDENKAATHGDIVQDGGEYSSLKN